MFVLSMDFRDQAPSNARKSFEIPAAILLNMQAATAPRNKLYEPWETYRLFAAFTRACMCIGNHQGLVIVFKVRRSGD